MVLLPIIGIEAYLDICRFTQLVNKVGATAQASKHIIMSVNNNSWTTVKQKENNVTVLTGEERGQFSVQSRGVPSRRHRKEVETQRTAKRPLC